MTGGTGRGIFGRRRRRREEELAAADRWRVARRLMDEDVTVLGEQLAELHLDTLADELDATTRDHYRRALEHYDQATHLLIASRSAEDVAAIEQVTADARYHRAAVLALLAGEPLPQRREPCFFDPRHGPAMQDLDWTPPGGTPRTIAVCAADARRITAGEKPLERLVRVGDRWVPWHQSASPWGVHDATSHYLSQGHGPEVMKAIAEAQLGSTGGAYGAGGGMGGGLGG